MSSSIMPPGIVALAPPASWAVGDIALTFVCLLLLALLGLQLHRRRQAAQQLRTASTAEQAAVRQLRLASHQMRAIGLGLRGHADVLVSAADAESEGLMTAADEVFDLADHLHEWARTSQAVLREEALNLSVVMEEAIAAIARAIGRGTRQWNVQPELATTLISADRRALRHVITRALTLAVRSSRQHDAVRITLRRDSESVAVTVAVGSEASGHADASSLAMPMTLAHVLMEAHGGRIEALSHGLRSSQGGTRISIVFPIARLLREGTELAATAPLALTTPAPERDDSRLERARIT